MLLVFHVSKNYMSVLTCSEITYSLFVFNSCVSTDGLYGCECHAGWVGTFCDTPCTLDCGEHGYCGRVDDNDTVGCICHWNYTGHRCKDKRKIVHGVIGMFVL